MALDLIIRANEFAPMLAFYRDVLGFRPILEQPDEAIYRPGENWIALDTGGTRLELFARRVPQPPTTAPPPPDVPAIRVTGLAGRIVELRARGVRFVREGRQAWSVPAGHSLEVDEIVGPVTWAHLSPSASRCPRASTGGWQGAIDRPSPQALRRIPRARPRRDRSGSPR